MSVTQERYGNWSQWFKFTLLSSINVLGDGAWYYTHRVGKGNVQKTCSGWATIVTKFADKALYTRHCNLYSIHVYGYSDITILLCTMCAVIKTVLRP